MKHLARRILFSALIPLCSPLFAAEQNTDLLVYSGSPAGVMSAVAAARNGLSVTLVDMNNHIGGVMAGGLLDTDTGDASTISGLSAEFFHRINRHYLETYGADSIEYKRCRRGYHFEPKIAEQIFLEMLAEQNVTVIKNHRFRSLTRKPNGDITTVTFEHLASPDKLPDVGASLDDACDATKSPPTLTLAAAYFIDASYEGDLMAAAGVPWTYGREARSQYNESLAGIATDPDPSKIGTADHRTMSYNYRVTLTNKPGNTVPFAKPQNYDPSPFAKNMPALMNAIKRGQRPTFASLYVGGETRANPNAKYDTNWFDDGDSSENYAISDWPTREKIAAKIRDYAQSQLFYYATNPDFPQNFRDDVAKWGYPKDEYTDNNHWPFQLYVREARRMVGLHILTQHDITRTRFSENGIATGSYGIDCKVVRWLNINGKRVLDNTRHYVPAPYDIPYGTLCPPDKPGQPTNLLVPLCCSATHVAYCSLRMEPVYMMLGHAAGTAIAIAWKNKTSLQKLDPQILRTQLRKEKAKLDDNYLPLLEITHTPETPMPSESVTFSLKPLAPLRDPVKNIWWDLVGGGSVSGTGNSITHTFSQGKIHNISALIEDEAGRLRLLTMQLPVGDAENADLALDDAETQLANGELTGRWRPNAPRGASASRTLHTGPGYLRAEPASKSAIRYDFRQVAVGRYRVVHSQPHSPDNATNITAIIRIPGKPDRKITIDQRKQRTPFPYFPFAGISITQPTDLSIEFNNTGADGNLVTDGVRLLRMGDPKESKPATNTPSPGNTSAGILPADATQSRPLAPIQLPDTNSTSHSLPATRYFGALKELPLTSIRPEGWLREYFQRQRDGLGTHFAQSGFPYNSNLWIGLIQPAAWSRYEQTAFLLDGIHRAAVLMGDKNWQKIGHDNIRNLLDTPQPNGVLGKTPAEMNLTKESGFSPAQWPFAVLSRAIFSEYDATQNPEILEKLTTHYLALADDLGKYARDASNIEGMVWLYSKTLDTRILQKAIDTYNNFEKHNKSRHRTRYLSGAPITGHGAIVGEVLVNPVNLYLYTGEKTLLAATQTAIDTLNKNDLLPSFTISSAEEISGNAPEHVHEVCAQVDHTWILQKLLLATAETRYADQIEKSVLNAGLGSLSKDFKSHQYFSSPNQAVSTQTSSGIVKFGPANLNRQAYRPGHTVQCCTGSIHRILSNYAGQLWLLEQPQQQAAATPPKSGEAADSDARASQLLITNSKLIIGGEAASSALVKPFYAPNTLTTQINNQPIRIHEETNYPFDEKITFRIETQKPIRLTLKLRIPAWTQNPKIQITNSDTGAALARARDTENPTATPGSAGFQPADGAAAKPIPDTYHTITRTFANNDTITLTLPMPPRIERTPTNALTVTRGPLLYSVKIKEKATPVTNAHNTSETYPAWDLLPDSPWNYALNPDDESKIQILRNRQAAAGTFPWDPETTPVTLTIPAHRVENLQLTPDNKNPSLPQSPILSPLSEQIELIPYGTTRLRWTVFPEAK